MFISDPASLAVLSERISPNYLIYHHHFMTCLCWFFVSSQPHSCPSRISFYLMEQKPTEAYDYIAYTPLIAGFQLSSTTRKHWRKLDGRRLTIYFPPVSSLCRGNHARFQESQRSLTTASGSGSSGHTRRLSRKHQLQHQRSPAGGSSE